MVNKDLIIPKENIYKTEEIRYLDNNENYQPNKFLKSIFSNTYCADEEKKQKAAVAGVGGSILAGASLIPPLAPFAQCVAATETVLGKGVEKIGEATGNEEMKEGGKMSKEMGEIGSFPSIVKSGVGVLDKAAKGGN